MPDRAWYLLVHRLPAEPIYLRAKVGRILSRAGALALKNSVYLLPRRVSSLADLRWILEEARASGGEAFLWEARFLASSEPTPLVDRFNAERNARYEALSSEIREALDFRRVSEAAPAPLPRFRKRLAQLRAIDFFDAPARTEAEALLRSIERGVAGPGSRGRKPRPTSPTSSTLRGRTWTTRPGLHIDRLGSAWLIRRFIDPQARFRFVDPSEARRPGELRFDVVGGDFTHEGDRCTFETLLRTVAKTDPALRQIAEVVHDIDLKDGKFARLEALGVAQVVLGIVLDSSSDDERLRRGFALFDDLYASFRKRTPSAKESPR